MERIGCKGVAARFSRHTGQHPPAHPIDNQGYEDRAEGQGVGVDQAGCAEPLHGFDGDADCQHDEKARLRKRGDRFDLRVTERMVLVCGHVGHANREIGGRAGGDVDGVVGALGEQRKRTCQSARAELGERERDAGANRRQGRVLLARRYRRLVGVFHRGAFGYKDRTTLCAGRSRRANPKGRLSPCATFIQ